MTDGSIVFKENKHILIDYKLPNDDNELKLYNQQKNMERLTLMTILSDFKENLEIKNEFLIKKT